MFNFGAYPVDSRTGDLPEGTAIYGVDGTFDVTSSVQAWTDGRPNYGWALVQVTDAVEFPLATAADSDNGPRLTVRYIPAEQQTQLAWLLATCSEESFRDPTRAVELARRATRLSPESAGNWTVRGVAHYRVGKQHATDHWARPIGALEKSQKIGGENGINLFFLAMSWWKSAEYDSRIRSSGKQKAQGLYDRAVKWMEENDPDNEELLRFRAEAEALMNIDDGEEEQEADAPRINGK